MSSKPLSQAQLQKLNEKKIGFNGGTYTLTNALDAVAQTFVYAPQGIMGTAARESLIANPDMALVKRLGSLGCEVVAAANDGTVISITQSDLHEALSQMHSLLKQEGFNGECRSVLEEVARTLGLEPITSPLGQIRQELETRNNRTLS